MTADGPDPKTPRSEARDAFLAYLEGDTYFSLDRTNTVAVGDDEIRVEFEDFPQYEVIVTVRTKGQRR